jgi:hypothetical protein
VISPARSAANFFKRGCGALQFSNTFGGRQPQLRDQQCQIDAIVPGRFDLASARGMKQTIFGMG